MMRFFCVLLLVTLPAPLIANQADKLHVAVASNFAAPMRALAKVFEQTHDAEMVLTLGASGKFAAQIQNGAPFDVFLSADQDRPATLEQKSVIVPGSRFTYAVGSLVLWSNMEDSGPLDTLKSGSFRRLAVANPHLAPYGTAAIETLQFLGLYEETKNKLVYGENIGQTYAFIHSGNVNLGFVARSQVAGQTQTALWPVPENMHNPIRQDAVIVKSTRHRELAFALWKFLQSARARTIIERYGYSVEQKSHVKR